MQDTKACSEIYLFELEIDAIEYGNYKLLFYLYER